MCKVIKAYALCLAPVLPVAIDASVTAGWC